ncbi:MULTISPECIES: PilW family protein [Pasteurellaceae]|uniref:Type II secretory pathway, component PulJ n=1 Tax=Pasteurella atlantica TaxID=2827233 RepID=A0AAW8CS87_9PAST|nr:hypothetical protein [Pasteurella atlantica]MBR0574341.1 hypothetical protein [Pasteurella atlantica]MDP8040276.1 hypothetical protein [Pasteurella atlantica]MDP8042358.1 hypothetical protein [Pasteurella atlantica]MDP8044582.1 hypothetical protein [Pasteurella atlantica]MDP8046563.1 hypothetical protein [Pasteurella atlantica]
MLLRRTKQVNVAFVKVIQAVTLVELLASLSLMVTLLFALSSFYSDSYKNQHKLQTTLSLQQNAQQIMNFFKQHIQHIYYQGIDRENSNYFAFTYNKSSVAIKPQCLVFFYDINSDGCVGNRKKKSACFVKGKNNTSDVAKEVFGFKVDHQELYIYQDSSISKCSLIQCKQLLAQCDQGKWGKLTQYNNYKISQLSFSWLKEHKVMQVLLSLTKNNQTYSTQSYIYILNNEKII